MSRSVSTNNPASGQPIATYELQTEEQAKRVVDNSKRVFQNEWSKLKVSQRAEYFRSLAKVLRSGKSEYARTMTEEMGKPITQSISEVEKCAWSAEIFSDNAEGWLSDETVETDAKRSRVSFEPLGVILSIMPWNFPFSQVFRFSIPAILAGNTTVLKHSQVCTGSALNIQEIFNKAGFPDGVFSNLIIDHQVVSDLVGYDGISGVSLTGSVGVGERIGELAGRNMKKCVLELGGSDAFIVLEDADVTAASKGAADSRLLNSGQSCINAKRFIVVSSVVAEFKDKFVQEFQKRRVGDPTDPRTEVGPLATSNQVDIIENQVKEAISKSAQIEIGGRRREGPGSYFLPTIVSKVDPEMRIMKEEVFGPVAPVYVVDNAAQAVSVANNSEFGLGASLWTANNDKAFEIARSLECGMVTINAPVRSDPRMPFGGVKKSGIGRETSKYGMREFVNIKSIRAY
ncbi:MAG TPA: NAD-dependent succinate-semialdehyde dehydrogenase [Nitrososphaerales archaeon]|nr:NAD-dependent succinate-semialdehyde dehydrogenase [Nitrososphaerales archaeon]